jgi:hypothetical protein
VSTAAAVLAALCFDNAFDFDKVDTRGDGGGEGTYKGEDGESGRIGNHDDDDDDVEEEGEEDEDGAARMSSLLLLSSSSSIGGGGD